jgi:hypothetical protein
MHAARIAGARRFEAWTCRPFLRPPLRLGDLAAGHLGCHRIAQPQIIFPVALRRVGDREVQPHVGVDLVQRNAEALVVHQAEQILGRGVALLGGKPIPIGRCVVALRNALAVRIHEAQERLRSRIAVLCRRHQQPRCPDVIAARIGGPAGGERVGVRERGCAEPQNRRDEDDSCRSTHVSAPAVT